MPQFQRDALSFNYRETGAGIPFVFQHGLGGDVSQPFGLFLPPPGFRLLAFDCRGHGETRPLGDPEKISIASFADDLLALLDTLALPRAIVGGISMGAAVALNFTLRNPGRARALVLSRAAWLAGPMPENARIFSDIARLIGKHGAREGEMIFKQSSAYQEIARQSADVGESLLMQFRNPRAEETFTKFERIARDAPLRDLRELARIRVPTLVLANRQDPIHPFEYGEELARLIPGAEFHEITAKSVSKEQHAADVQCFISDFLQRHFSGANSC
jgi:pimeloyl-ACP methyl ester carboxylesterase